MYNLPFVLGSFPTFYVIFFITSLSISLRRTKIYSCLVNYLVKKKSPNYTLSKSVWRCTLLFALLSLKGTPMVQLSFMEMAYASLPPESSHCRKNVYYSSFCFGYLGHSMDSRSWAQVTLTLSVFFVFTFLLTSAYRGLHIQEKTWNQHEKRIR
jgi:hypothetical protein